MKRATVVLMAMMVSGSAMAQQARPAAPAVPPPAPKGWFDKITVKGDLRYRYETINDDSKLNADKETFERQRDRIRAKAGIESKISDTLKGGVELSTGQSDPVSGNQSLGDTFGKKDMKLNLAYVDWAAVSKDPTKVNIVAGKMKNPFINVSDLVWDGDLTPEGLAAKAQFGGERMTLLANAGYLWVQERSADSDDTMLYAGQTAIRIQPIPEVYALVGGSFYATDHLKGYQVLDWEAKNGSYGNSTVNGSVAGSVTNKNYATDYTPVEFFAEIGTFIAGVPVTLYGQLVSNGDADDFENGHLYGLSVGKAKNVKTCEVGYRYAELEKDAVVGAFTDSDRWGGGTDGKSHKVYGKYQVAKNVQLGATYFMDEKKISDAAKTTDYDRMQLDVSVTF